VVSEHFAKHNFVVVRNPNAENHGQTIVFGNDNPGGTSVRNGSFYAINNTFVFTQANTYSCFPGCTNDGDCAVFGSGYTCQIVEDVDGYYPAVCSL